MPKLTQTQAIINALLKRGYTEVSDTSRKYRAFVRPSDTEVMHIFIGKAGAVRRGRNITNSVSLERTPVRKMLLKEGGWDA
jgi:hypothetical protein